MRKYYCDKCGKELTARELHFSLDMIGKELCSKHAQELIDITKNVKYVKKFEHFNSYDLNDVAKANKEFAKKK
jgi:hypothetical protein